eukprot:Gb_16082 [translate_table: standard]
MAVPLPCVECKVDINPPEKGRSEHHIVFQQNSTGQCTETVDEVKPKKENFMVSFFKKLRKLGKDDPRKIAHAFKVGLALCVVSLMYFADPVFDGIGDSGIWAVMTVVVVFEFTAGATLSKGLNRGFGTLLAGSLALVVGYLADRIGDIGEAILIGVVVFGLGTAATYIRFLPNIKSKYDYGVLVFLLTFNMITVSGYQHEKIYVMAYSRLLTIAAGSAICVIISLLIYPIWAGEDLHFSICGNFECLILSLEGCVQEYFNRSDLQSLIDKDKQTEDLIHKKYKTVLDSKSTEESLATFASWEPRHGRFHFRYPWKQYLKIGTTLRQCTYSLVALHGCVCSEIQAPPSIRAVFKTHCSNVSNEVVRVLEEVANSIRRMRSCRSRASIMEKLHLSVENLHDALNGQRELFLYNSPHVVTVKEEKGSNKEKTNDSASSRVDRDVGKQLIPREEYTRAGRFIRDVVSLGNNTSTDDLSDSASSRVQTAEFRGAFGVFTFAYVLMELAAKVEHVVESVEELGKLGGFKTRIDDEDEEEFNCSLCCCWSCIDRQKITLTHDIPPNQNAD